MYLDFSQTTSYRKMENEKNENVKMFRRIYTFTSIFRKLF